jgi:hypothetical protein
MLLTLGISIEEIGATLGRFLTRLVYAFDGVDEYMVIPEVILVSGDTVCFAFKAPSSYGASAIAFTGGGTSRHVFIDASGNWAKGGTVTSATLDGVALTMGTAAPTDEIEHIVEFISAGGTLDQVASTNGGFLVPFPIYNLKIINSSQ